MTNTQFRIWLEQKIENLDDENQYYLKKALEDVLTQFYELCDLDDVEYV